MDRLLLITCFFLVSLSLQAQITATLEPNPASAKVDVSEFQSIAYATLTNTSETDTLRVKWAMNQISITDGWSSSVCDNNKCYGPETPESPENRPVILPPGESSNLDVYIYPDEKDGAAEVEVLVTNLADSTLTLLGSYVFDTSTSTSDIFTAKEIKIYPNPSSSSFQIKNDANVRKIKVYNIIGKEISSYNHIRGSAYDISGYQKGIYIIRLFDKSEQMLNVLRLNKK